MYNCSETKKSDSRRTFGTKITNHAYLIDKMLSCTTNTKLVLSTICYYHVANGKTNPRGNTVNNK